LTLAQELSAGEVQRAERADRPGERLERAAILALSVFLSALMPSARMRDGSQR